MSQVADGVPPHNIPRSFFLVSIVPNPHAHFLRRKEAGRQFSLVFLKPQGQATPHTYANPGGLGAGRQCMECGWQAPQADLLSSNLSSISSTAVSWAQGQNKVHQAQGLESRDICSPSTRGWKSKIKVSAWTVSPEASLFGIQQTTVSSLCHHMIYSSVSLCPDLLFLEGHHSYSWVFII